MGFWGVLLVPLCGCKWQEVAIGRVDLNLNTRCALVGI